MLLELLNDADGFTMLLELLNDADGFTMLLEGSKDLGVLVMELSGDIRRLKIEITIYPDNLLFISADFLPRVSWQRLN